MSDDFGIGSIVDENIFEPLQADATDVAVAFAYKGLAADGVVDRAFAMECRVRQASAVAYEEYAFARGEALHGRLQYDAEYFVHVYRLFIEQTGELIDAVVERALENDFA